jgi:Xaa-Pro aminopeptidase
MPLVTGRYLGLVLVKSVARVDAYHTDITTTTPNP